MTANESAAKAIDKAFMDWDRPIRYGIFIMYHDHLNMDAYKVQVWSGRDIKASFSDVMMWSDSDYYGTKGLKTTVNSLKELFKYYPVVWVDCTWHTFSHEYSFDQEVPGYMKEAWPDIQTLHINKLAEFCESQE